MFGRNQCVGVVALDLAGKIYQGLIFTQGGTPGGAARRAAELAMAFITELREDKPAPEPPKPKLVL